MSALEGHRRGLSAQLHGGSLDVRQQVDRASDVTAPERGPGGARVDLEPG